MMIRRSLVRPLLVLFTAMMAMVLVAVFAGIGYFVLTFALFHLALTVVFYNDRLYLALVGEELFSALGPSIRRTRESRGLRILFVVNNVIFLALSVFSILRTNVPLVELMRRSSPTPYVGPC